MYDWTQDLKRRTLYLQAFCSCGGTTFEHCGTNMARGEAKLIRHYQGSNLGFGKIHARQPTGGTDRSANVFKIPSDKPLHYSASNLARLGLKMTNRDFRQYEHLYLFIEEVDQFGGC